MTLKSVLTFNILKEIIIYYNILTKNIFFKT